MGKCGQKISISVGFTNIKAMVGKCGQKISTSVGFTKIKAMVGKCCQKISTSVGFTKIRAFVGKCCQNCANLLCRNIISRASPENETHYMDAFGGHFSCPSGPAFRYGRSCKRE